MSGSFRGTKVPFRGAGDAVLAIYAGRKGRAHDPLAQDALQKDVAGASVPPRRPTCSAPRRGVSASPKRSASLCYGSPGGSAKTPVQWRCHARVVMRGSSHHSSGFSPYLSPGGNCDTRLLVDSFFFFTLVLCTSSSTSNYYYYYSVRVLLLLLLTER